MKQEKCDGFEKIQGVDTSRVFSGKSTHPAMMQIYGESDSYFAQIIRQRLPVTEEQYHMGDFGSFKGELLHNVCKNLQCAGYTIKTTALDRSETALQNNPAHEKIVTSLTRTPLDNGSFDMSICRYALAWNSLEEQGNILSELSRVNKHFAIVQHVGADVQDSEAWRERINYLLSGKDIPRLNRENHYFSSLEEIEDLMRQRDIRFERLEEKRIEKVSQVFIERYSLNQQESELAKKIMADKDYIVRSTWLIYPNSQR